MGLSLEDLKQMSVVSLVNIITTPIRQKESDELAKQSDIDKLFA